MVSLDSPEMFGVALTAMWGWENALLDRQSDCPVTIQIQTWNDGDFAFRYNFSAASPTNALLIGVQTAPDSATTALRIDSQGAGPFSVSGSGGAGGSPAVSHSATIYR